ncbi:hypothetical protein EDM56_29060 [Brevibacillus fluminis]|uniref:DUF3311 domain-containing protein n=1 Tax=Brevibacillus fluminis TaxID=511487 RepID=A0A3M8CXI3_9BACL|nr:hypothetical protein [Brevibacillus fluminis]RNB79575.1 hypothetical protein EDM56_29060 [Brevibacillus fluminis]
MKRGTVTLLFFAFCWVMLGTLVFPPVFRLINRIEPWVLGMPFVQFWIILVIVAISLALIVWYKTEEKRGEL